MSLYNMSKRRTLVIRYGMSDPHVIPDGRPKHIHVKVQVCYCFSVFLCKESCIDSNSLNTDMKKRLC